MLMISISFPMGVDMNTGRLHELLTSLEAAISRDDELSQKEIRKQIYAICKDIPVRTGTGRMISKKAMEEKGQ